MSRPRRYSPGGMVFHVLNRGVGRRVVFTKDEDFLAFERVVEETLRTRRMRLWAYCLMPNHWHFVVWPERDGDLPAFMQQVTNTHVKRWKRNRGAGRVCAVWSAKTRRSPFSRRGLCLAPPIGCNLSTSRKRKPKWRRC